VIVDCAVYLDGIRIDGHPSVEEAYREARRRDGVVWLGLWEPTADEFASVQRQFGLHELAVEDALKAHQRPKLEVYDETLFAVLKTARYVDELEEVEFGEILLFVGENFVVSVRHGEASGLAEARRGLERRPEMLGHGGVAVLHAIFDRVVDDYAPVVAGLENDIEEVEAELFTASRSSPAERIYKLKREVIDFSRATYPLLLPLERLAGHPLPGMAPELQHYFRDVHDHLQRTVDAIESFRDLLNSILEVNLTQVSVRQNDDMRKISAWVAIAAVPTLVAGVYGMNFEHMPELDWRWGYFGVLGVIALACASLFITFRRRGWL